MFLPLYKSRILLAWGLVIETSNLYQAYLPLAELSGDKKLSLRIVSTSSTGAIDATFASKEGSAAFRPQLVLSKLRVVEVDFPQNEYAGATVEVKK